MRLREGCCCVRAPPPECAEPGSCIPEAPRSWGVGAWGGRGGGEGGKRRGDAESPGEKGGAPAPCQSSGDESRSARRAETAAPRRGQEVSAEARRGGRGCGRGPRPEEERAVCRPARRGVAEDRGSSPPSSSGGARLSREGEIAKGAFFNGIAERLQPRVGAGRRGRQPPGSAGGVCV